MKALRMQLSRGAALP